MILRRTILCSLAWLLSASSMAFAFQLPQRSTPKISLPATVSHPAVARKMKPAQFHTPVAAHIHYPKRRPAPHHPVVKRYGVGGKIHTHSILSSHKTSVTANSGSVTLSVNLGKPATSVTKVTVTNAPLGMKFSKVGWQSLRRRLPSGITPLSAQGASSAMLGAPEIPMLNFTFAVPENAINITPFLKVGSTAALGTIHFPPSPKTIKGKLQRVYDAATASTSPAVTIGKPHTFRSLRMVTVSVPLVSSSGGEASALEAFTVGINFSTTEAPAVAASAKRDPLFATLNSKLVANTWDLSSFAVPLRQKSSQKPLATKQGVSKNLKFSTLQNNSDSVTDWIDTNAAYVRLAITRDGLYRVNASDLNFSPNQNFTLATSGWTPQNVRCFNHGVEIPIWIDVDSSGNIADIEFYGQHLRGFPLPTVLWDPYLFDDYQVQEGGNFTPSDSSVRLPEYYNVATDTNVYWLTSSGSGSAPLRYAAKSPTAAGSPVISSGTVLLHHEEDKNYYLGDAGTDETETQEMTEYVPGERFVWAELYGTDANNNNPALSHFTDTFYISQLPSDAAGQVATFSFLFRGMSNDGTNIPHTVQAQVGNIKSLQVNFLGYLYDSLTMSVPLSQLVVGPNVVQVNAYTLGDSTDEFYLDYYWVNLETALAPSTDTGIAKGQWLFSISPSSAKYQLAMTDNSAHLYNLTDNTRILDPSGQFIDSTSSIQPQYAAATTSSILKCDNIQPWNTASANVLTWQILKPQNQADYIVITHPNFRQAAAMLASLRNSQGLKTKVVTTDEIFNAFDYGSNEPEAIRRYLNYAYYHYSGTPVSFVTLLGNASWDPKFNQAGDVQQSFVPSYGNPVSDAYFTLPESDTDLDSLPLMMIARIPVATEAAAETYITKLQEYENTLPAQWDRNFMFIAGGDTGTEHFTFDYDFRNVFAPPLNAPPIDVQDTVIDRTDFSSGVDASHIGQIENLLLTGQSVMYFGGHGATFTSDVAFPDASVLQNKGLYPLLITLTCRTGAFAEPNQIGVNQSYIEAPEAGSVQAYGTTGFGVAGYDELLTTNWIALMQSFDSAQDTMQTMNMLQMLTSAKMAASELGFGGGISHNEALQNSMLGDGAIGFALRPLPEFAVFPSGISAYAPGDAVPQTSFSLNDSFFAIQAVIYNYGYAADRPVVIEITDNTPTGPISRFDTLPGINDSAYASATFGLNAQSVGLHQICVTIDPNHQFPGSDAANNSACIPIPVYGLSTTAFSPYEGERDFCDISTSNVHFIVLPPSGSNPNDQVELELDTTELFTSIQADKKTSIGTGYYVTFDIVPPVSAIPYSTVYWWRTRVVRTTGDTTQWQVATFSTGTAPRPEFSYTSSQQLGSTMVNGLAVNTSGMLYLSTLDTLRFEAISHGIDDSVLGQTFTPYAQVFLNGISFWEDSAVFNGSIFDNGFVVLVWTPDSSQIDTVNEFEMPWDSIKAMHFEDSMANIFNSVLAAIPPKRLVMVLTVGSVQFNQYFFPAVQAQMESLGSDSGMSPMGYDGSYSLIGSKGSSPGTAKENFAQVGSSGAMAFDTIVTQGTSGLAETPYTAVAKDYDPLTWTGTTASGNDIKFTVLGARRDGSGVDIVDTFRASAGNSFSLSNVDPRIYDQLSVQMGFMRTTNTSQSPALSSIALQYDPAPEFTFAGDSILSTPKIVSTGGTTIATYAATTLTCTPGDSVLVMLTRHNQSLTDTPVIHQFVQIAGHGSQQFNDTLQTQGELGYATLTAVVNPNEAQNEQLLFNNTINGSYTVTRDTMSPSGEILFVDPSDQVPQHIPANCGYVSSNSTIELQLVSSNPLRATSSSSITASFDDENTNQILPVSLASPGGFQVKFQAFPGGPVQAQLTITPTTPFPAGTWNLLVYLRDASGNVDTLQQCFTVSNVNGIEEVMNYPNPFKETTDFTFILKSDAPANIKIVVYTIAGRKIRTLTPTATHAGFNAVEWDGRDERGNEVANGTYLYRVVINGTNGDNVSDAVSQTAVRAR
jgi:hypothetical protein